MATAPYLRRVSRSAPAACFTARPPPVGSPETVPYSPSSRELRIPAKEIAHSDLNRLFHDETEEWVVRLPVISKAGVAPNLGARLDAACDSAMISHQEQGARIGIGRSTYFEVKAGRGGKKARRRAEEYLRSLQMTQKPD
jgi:hypothetical protein